MLLLIEERVLEGMNKKLSLTLSSILILTALFVATCSTPASSNKPNAQQSATCSHTQYPYPSLYAVCVENLYTNVHASAHLRGYTIALQKAYLDANTFAFWYSITAPNGHTITQDPTWHDLSLTSPQGGQAGKAGVGLIDTPEHYDSVQHMDQETLFLNKPSEPTQDLTSIIPANAQEVPLHLKPEELTLIPGQSNLPNNIKIKVPGTITFDIALPSHAKYIIDYHQAVTINGGTITLTYAVITPSSTALYLQGAPLAAKFFTVNYAITINSKPEKRRDPIFVFQGTENIRAYSPSLGNQRENWKLQLTIDSYDMIGETTWTFDFTIPAATA